MVQVYEQQGYRIAGALATRPLPLQGFIEMASAGDARQGVGGGVAAQLIREVLQPQLRSHPSQHDRGFEGLWNEVSRPHVEGGRLKTGLAMTGDEYHRHIRQLRFRLQLIEQLEAADPRHLGIQKNQIRDALTSQSQRVLAVGCKAQGAHIGKYATHELDGAGVIVDQQDVVIDAGHSDELLTSRRSGCIG